MPDRGRMRRDALSAGTVLGSYTLEQVLGHGGFGIVYRARHNELGHVVAIKEYLPLELAVREGATVQVRSPESQAPYEDGLRRFLEEARSLIQFQQHPNIVTCRDFFRRNGTAYLVMDYEDGESLTELLQRREAEGRPFGEADLKAVIEPLLEGLRQVHAAGMLHRDIKPGNILVRREDERPVLLDFGAAKQEVAERTKSLAPYTDGYAALEQIADDGQLGPWTDLYAVGAVMWRMVAGGNRPWEPPNPVKVERRANALVRSTADPMPRAVDLGAERFSAGVLQAIDGCLRLSEAEREQSSEQLLAALRGTDARVDPEIHAQAAASGELVAEKTATVEPRGGWNRTNWLRLAYGISLAYLLVVLFLALRPPQDKVVVALGPESMEFVRIEAGYFEMGSPEGEAGRYDDERAHDVRISRPFYLGKYEVTQGEWEAVMGSNPSGFKECGARCPVERVSWEDVQEFIRRLNELESGRGYEYRLPTEAEWEYAARAGTTGARYGELGEIAWYDANSGGSTQPVGQKGANGWGLHDMLGNVWEWVGDWYGEYPSGAVTDPRGPSMGSRRVGRGGSWHSSARNVRAAFRYYSSPGYRYNARIGFRLARTVSP